MGAILDHLKKLDWILIGAVVIIFLFGLLTLYVSPDDRVNFYKQGIFGIFALLVIIGASLLDYRLFRDNPFVLLGFYSLGILSLLLLFVVGSRIRGVTGWFVVGGFAMQPVELVKIAVLLVLAKYLSGRHIELYKLRHIFISSLYVFLPAGLVLVQPDLGSTIILIISWVGLVLISGIRLKQFFIVLLVGVVVLTLLWGFGLQDYQKNRILSFLDPARDPLGGGYQTRQAVIALGSGGLFGKGLGEGSQTRLGFLPEYQSDFIFSAIGEEWGLTGVFIVLGLWLVIFWRLYTIWQHSTNNFAQLFVGGVFVLFLTHVVINIGANLGLLPVTGIPLPFISAGGSNLLSFALALGLVLSIKSRSTAHPSLLQRPLEDAKGV